MSPAGVAGEAEPRKEAGLAGGGWGRYTLSMGELDPHPCSHPSPERSCSLVKVAGVEDAILWSNQARREIALP